MNQMGCDAWKPQRFAALPAKSNGEARKVIEAFPILYSGESLAGWHALADDQSVWHLPFETDAKWEQEPLKPLPKSKTAPRTIAELMSMTLVGDSTGWYAMADDQTFWYLLFDAGAKWEKPDREFGAVPSQLAD